MNAAALDLLAAALAQFSGVSRLHALGVVVGDDPGCGDLLVEARRCWSH